MTPSNARRWDIVDVHALQQRLIAKRRQLGLCDDGTRPDGPAPLGQILKAAFAGRPSPSEEELTYVCDCGDTVRPLRIDVLGTPRLVRGTCQRCKPALLAQWEEERRQQEATEGNRRLLRYHKAFPASAMGRLVGASFDDFLARPGTENGLRRAHEYMAALPHPEPEGLLLWGRPGNGKSHLAAAVANAARARDMAVAWLHVPTWLRGIGAMESAPREHTLLLAAQADLLVLDDLGAGKLTVSRVDWLLYLVEERYRHRRPLVATTNHDLDSLGDLLGRAVMDAGAVDTTDGDRLAERMMEMCRQVQITATSYRPELARRRLGVADG